MKRSTSSKKLSEIIEKWRKRKKGHFVVYTRDGKRFVLPLYYLNHPIFRVLLEMAEEEFGSTVHGPLQVPCEEGLMYSILSLLSKNNPSGEVEKALLSMTTCRGASFSSFLPLFNAHNQGENGNIAL
ncbi:auxin-responsive protein SAUR36 [Malania oleifera]|uniref:auxin-responsive protein SAUR36 n=1 Tax=Malania oleifera TaxID=397392 RepID=UPI0025AE3EA0|nr:auxin-responsive protein SAUR36 [Malania oleifera]